MSNIYGRQVILPLTNKSGGGVIAGDVVIVDTTNNSAFTTTTSAGFTGGVGIAQETIASNATGRVLTQGYAALVNVNASVTRGNFGKTHTVAKQATDAGASRGTGTFCQFLTGGTTPIGLVYPVDLLGSSLTNPMSAQDDIIIGGSSGTPTALVKGNAGAYLAMGNGHVIWNAGTSFPGSKATNDRYWRTDLGMGAYWDGTRWLSEKRYRYDCDWKAGLSATTTVGVLHTTDFYDTYVESLDIVNFESGQDGTNHYTFDVQKVSSAGANTSLGVTVATAANDSAYHRRQAAINTAVTLSTMYRTDIVATKNSAPSNIFGAATLWYRLILT